MTATDTKGHCSTRDTQSQKQQAGDNLPNTQEQSSLQPDMVAYTFPSPGKLRERSISPSQPGYKMRPWQFQKEKKKRLNIASPMIQKCMLSFFSFVSARV